VIDTSWAVFYPHLYEEAIASYQSPLFTIGEFGLVACVIYHAFNGLRIIIFDYKPQWWKHQEKAAYGVLGLSLITLIPVFVLMAGHVVDHYDGDPFVLPLGDVIVAQLPFIIGIPVAIVAAVLFSGITGVVAGGNDVAPIGQPSHVERFWWSYMRVSGLLIVPLVFGHLAMMHILQGVFDITAANHSVIGATLDNSTGAAVEFVGNRWNQMWAGVAIWKLYDAGLLLLVSVHGFNGLRYVLTDYTMSYPLARRAAVYLCVLGAAVLLIVGVLALLGTIDQTTIEMAVEAQAKIRQ
jgi:succinate dehydrogenase hydrophobic anchor subunit